MGQVFSSLGACFICVSRSCCCCKDGSESFVEDTEPQPSTSYGTGMRQSPRALYERRPKNKDKPHMVDLDELMKKLQNPGGLPPSQSSSRSPSNSSGRHVVPTVHPSSPDVDSGMGEDGANMKCRIPPCRGPFVAYSRSGPKVNICMPGRMGSSGQDECLPYGLSKAVFCKMGDEIATGSPTHGEQEGLIHNNQPQ